MFFKTIVILSIMIGSIQAKEMFQSVKLEQASLLQDGKIKTFCSKCGMNLIKFYKTDHAIIYKDGKKKQFCSMHCLVEELNLIDPNSIDKIMVIDVDSLKFINVQNAWYVVGSKIKGTMTKNSKYAFSSKKRASSFAKESGGEVMSYKDALEIAKKDYQKDMIMISKKRAMMSKKGQKVYEIMCDKEKISSLKYSGIGDLKAKILKDKLCKNIDPKKLQALSIFIATKTDSSNKNIGVPKDAKCPVCGMFVAKYPKWATIMETIDGEKLYFDGVKDMMKFYFSPKEFHHEKKKFKSIGVSDYYTLKLIDAKKAWFVIGSNIYGPMGEELIAFKNRDDAKTFLNEHHGKKIIKFSEIDEKQLYK